MSKPLHWLLVGIMLVSVLAGCSPAPAPAPQQAVKETVIVEKPVEVTREVEKQVTVKETVVVEKPAQAPANGIQDWELIKPEGVQKIEPMKLASRISSLDGKTIALRWNSKNNGDNFLNKLAELLAKEVPTAKVIKLWETDPTSVGQAGSVENAQARAKKIAALKPDIVIASQAD